MFIAGNNLLKTKVSEGERRETELTNQLQAAEGQLAAANERTAEKEASLLLRPQMIS